MSNNLGTILVLFILLVIVSCSFGGSRREFRRDERCEFRRDERREFRRDERREFRRDERREEIPFLFPFII
jgi:hypothetical protein